MLYLFDVASMLITLATNFFKLIVRWNIFSNFILKVRANRSAIKQKLYTCIAPINLANNNKSILETNRRPTHVWLRLIQRTNKIIRIAAIFSSVELHNPSRITEIPDFYSSKAKQYLPTSKHAFPESRL